MVTNINDILDVLGSFVNWLFSATISPGITLGSTILWGLLLYVVVEAFWIRK